MATQLGWGIIGLGMIAHKFADALQHATTGKLRAVGSRSADKSQAFAAKYGSPTAHASYEALLADPQVDAVYIATPNHNHAEWSIKAARAGKHILLEKPLATNYAEAMAVIEAAQYHDVFLMEAFMYRSQAHIARAVELIREGAIGEVRVIQTHFSYNMGPKLDNIRLQNEAAGGAIMDVGCYCMSLARLLAGAALGKHVAEPVNVRGVAHIGTDSRVDHYATAAVQFPNGILATLVTGSQVGIASHARVWGSKGHLIIPSPWFAENDKGLNTLIIKRDGSDQEETLQIANAGPLYTMEADALANHLAARQAPPPLMTWDDSLGNMEALDAWRASVGLVFDREKAEKLTTPVSTTPLQKRPNVTMRYGQVPGVTKPIARAVMGSMVINEARLPFSYALLDHYFEMGGNAIDTAFVYGGAGKSEIGVGKWIKARNLREEIVLIAKGAATMDCTPELVTHEMLISLDRLGVEYADLYLMHRDNPNVPVGEFVQCLNEHVKAGRIRAFGGSNWSTPRLQEANEYAAAHNLIPFTASSPNFALAHWNEPMWPGCYTATDAESRKWYLDSQMALFAWSSQASGLFTGRFTPESAQQLGLNHDIVRTWFNPGNFERLKRAEELAKKKGCTALQIALAYVLDQPLNLFALIGPRNIEETRTSLQALDVHLTPDDLAWLDLEK